MKNMPVLLASFFIFCTQVHAEPQRYALVDSSGIVQNVIALDAGSDYSPPSGLSLVLDAGAIAAPQGTYSKQSGFAPPVVVSQPVVAPIDATAKLKAFLASNPDVAKLISGQ